MKKMKAKVKLRDFVYCLINLYYIVVRKYSFQVEVKRYKNFYLCKDENYKNIKQTSTRKI